MTIASKHPQTDVGFAAIFNDRHYFRSLADCSIRSMDGPQRKRAARSSGAGPEAVAVSLSLAGNGRRLQDSSLAANRCPAHDDRAEAARSPNARGLSECIA